MLHQLIESKNHKSDNARKNGFLLSTLGVLVAVLVSGWTYSLFAKNFGMGTGDFELSSLVAPVPTVQQEEPPKPEPKQIPEREQSASNNERPTVIEKVALIENSLNKPPKLDESRKLNSSPLTLSEADDYTEGSQNRYDRNNDSDRPGENDGDGIKPASTIKDDKDDKIPEVVKAAPKTEEPKKITRPVSGGVLNGKATFLAKPPYPAAARALRLADSVSVQILIDENGSVISAKAVSGNPILRTVSETAARQSKFSPTKLSDQAVKVTGVIVYQFKP
jgi:periplasmic protein TonB